MIIQTYLPDEPVIRAVKTHDRSVFTEHDLGMRREALYPPYVRLANVLVWGKDERAARGLVMRIAEELRVEFGLDAAPMLHPVVETGSAGVEFSSRELLSRPQILGPTPCVIERAKDRYRFHIIVKAPLGCDLSGALSAAVSRAGTRPGVSIAVDVDAYDLM